MVLSRDDFEMWLFEMDDRLQDFLREIPAKISRKCDYSADSLSVLEKWLLQKYADIDEILQASEAQRLDMAATYVGEVFRKNAGGVWNIDLKNKKNVYYRIPVVEKRGSWVECPVTLITAAVDDRSGDFIKSVLEAVL